MEMSQDARTDKTDKSRWVIEKLAVENFKSYKGKHDIGPFTDFSCVIGPNGSGKSNAMDAVSFVLGVDKKEMRAKSTASLVYEVQGQEPAKKAVVEMMFKKRDAKGHNERVVFKATVSKQTGDVRYYVDGENMGKRAYHEAMASYNIHVTSDWTNFLVFQGQVEQIAMKDPKQITEMIEQVSGSKTLKAEYDEKKEAWQKAEDAVAEASKAKRTAGVERGQLKLHQKEAEKYHALLADLKEAKTIAGLAHFYFIETTIQKNKKHLEDAKESVAAEQARTKRIEDNLKEKKGQVAELHKQTLALMKTDRDKQHKLMTQRRTADEMIAQTAQMKKKITKTTEALDQAKDQDKERYSLVAVLDRDLKEQQEILKSHEKDWAAEDKKGGGQLSAADYKEFLVLREQCNASTITKTQSMKDAKVELAQIQEQINSYDRAKLDNATRIRYYEGAIKEAEKKIMDIQGQGEQQTEELKQVKAEHKAIADRVKLLKQVGGTQEQELRTLAAQLTGIRADREENRREEKMRHALEDLKKTFPGVKGRLCDLVKIPEARYKTAMAVAMGKNLEAIVTDTEKTAHSCVRYLRDFRLATMNFIPLDSVRGKEVSDQLRMIVTGPTKTLADCLEYSPEIKPAVRYAIGECLVTDNMKDAQHFAWDHPQGRNKVVITDGTVLMKNGVMQGGSLSGAKRGMKFDEKQYEKLKEKRDKLLVEQRDTHDELSRLEGRERELNSQVIAEAGRAEFQRSDIKDWEKKRKAAQSQLETHMESEKGFGPKLKDVHGKHTKTAAKVAQLEKEVSEVEHKILGAFGKRCNISNIRDYERRILLRDKERAEKRAQISGLIARLENQIEFEKKKDFDGTPEQLEKVIKRLRDELKDNERQAKLRSADCEKLEDEVKEGGRQLEEKQQTMKKAENESKECKRSYETCNDELRDAQKHRHQLTSILDMLRQQRNQLYEKCRIEEIEIPLAKVKPQERKDGDDADEGDDEAGHKPGYVTLSEAFSSESHTQSQAKDAKGGGKSTTSDLAKLGAEGMITIDFKTLPTQYRTAVSKGEAAYKGAKQLLTRDIERMNEEIDKINPNLKAGEKLGAVDGKLKRAEDDVAVAAEERRRAQLEYRKIEEKRTQKYHDSFNVISVAIDPIYKMLTGSLRDGQATGQAFLQQMSQEEPYLHGTSYDVMPPKKRSRSMHELSGGEKTLAALALLFAIHRACPSPFYILDEVDAALDRYNTEQVISFVQQSKVRTQFLVATHKDQFYASSETLCGVHKIVDDHSSGMKTLDLRPLHDDAPEYDDADAAGAPSAGALSVVSRKSDGKRSLSGAASGAKRGRSAASAATSTGDV